MANLGSDDTPIVGESFGLPSGWAITENADGEVVIEDSGGNVVFRRDETAGEWVTDSIDAESVSVEDAESDRIVENDAPEVKTWTQDGSDINTRLSNALTDLSDGQILRLEPGDYDSVTLSDQAIVLGCGAGVGGSRIDATMTIDTGQTTIQNISIDGGLLIDALRVSISNCIMVRSDSEMTIADDEVVIGNITGAGSITFEADTEGGSTAAISGQISVTDNGNNEILGQ